MYDIENQTLQGKDVNGVALTIKPGDIQAKGLLVAIPGSGAEMLKDPAFAAQLEEMAKEADTIIEVVPVTAFEE